MSDDCAETRDADLPKRMGDATGLADLLRDLEATHYAKPLQTCPTCRGTYRHERGGRCYDCAEKALKAKPENFVPVEPEKPRSPTQPSLLERTAGRDP